MLGLKLNHVSKRGPRSWKENDKQRPKWCGNSIFEILCIILFKIICIVIIIVVIPHVYDSFSNMRNSRGLFDLIENDFRVFSILRGIRVCWQRYGKNGSTDFHYFFRTGEIWHREISATFWGFCVKPLGPRVDLFICRIRACWQHYGKTGTQIFMKFSWYIWDNTTK